MGQKGRWTFKAFLVFATLFGCASETTVTNLAPKTNTPEQQIILDQQLLNAAETGDLETVKLTMQAGANVNSADDHGFSVLVNALAHYQLELIEYLIVRGAVTRRHPSLIGPPAELAGPSITPTEQQVLNEALLTAVESHDLVEVKRLLNAGADINAADEDGFTVLVTALSSYHLDVVEYLVEHGATIAQI
jgi:ankyrin repeat protein